MAMMFMRFFTYELRYRARQISTWIYFGLIFFTSFLGVLGAGGLFTGVEVNAGDSTGKVFLNSPYIIFNFSALWSYLGLFIITAVMMNITLRDFDSGAFPMFFTKPIHKLPYLAGRFAGGFTTLVFIFSGIGLGIFLATALPILDAEKIGPFHLAFFLNPYLVMILPNLFILAALFFSVSILTRRAMPVYSIAVLFFVGYMLALGMMSSLDNHDIASLIEPLGFIASMISTLDYWTIVQKNTQTIPLEGLFLINRLVWVGLSIAAVLITLWRFRFTQFIGDSAGSRSTTLASVSGFDSPEPLRPARHTAPAHQTPPVFSTEAYLTMLLRSIRYEALAIMKSVPFIIIVLAAVLFLAINTRYIGYVFGTPGYPVTYKILQNLGGQFIVFILIIITFFSGETVWRSREQKFHPILDALPVPGWISYLAKTGAMSLILLMLLGVVFIAGIIVQTIRGYYHYELALYFIDLLGYHYPAYILLAALTIAVQSVVPNKFMGHFVMILYYMMTDFMEEFGFQHILYAYGRTIGKIYSDMNGYGHYVWPHIVLNAYWFCIAALLLVIGFLFRPHGTELHLRHRLRVARNRWTPGLRNTVLVLIGCGSALGGYIYYNTNILNQYRTSWEVEVLQVEYERLYKQYEDVPMPRVTDVRLDVELYPEHRAMEARGTFQLVNSAGVPLEEIYLTIPETDIVIDALTLDRPCRRGIDDSEHRFFSLIPETAVQPGETVTMSFSVAYRPRGFPNARMNNDFVENGTFFNNKAYLPTIGYWEGLELTGDVARRKHDLPTKPRMADLNDPAQRMNNYVTSDADWIRYEAVIGTAPDQLAVTCGHLVREWLADGRRYFHYRMDRPMINFYPILSARYCVRSERHNGVDYSIYYHPGHEWNLDRMMDAMKKSIDYYSAQFSPFQFDQLRIIEFPRYKSFAQSFANTIPYSESAGFVAEITDDAVDYPFGITAHETAHQWWAHQVIGANVQGTTMLTEMLAQYGELMMARNEYPEKITRKYLRYELDHYLRGRSFEAYGELPMILNENQGYIHYSKSSMIMNLLQDTLGAETVNLALSDFLKDYAYPDPPYPRSIDLLPYFYRVCPERYRYLITDVFERIVLYDNKVTEVVVRPVDEGGYRVTISATARKSCVEGLGDELDEPLNDWIEFGVLDENGEVLCLEKHLVGTDAPNVTLHVDRAPAKAGIDPLNKLIDKHPGDNVTPCSVR